MSNNVKSVIESGRKSAFLVGGFVIALGVAAMLWRSIADPKQVPLIAIALVIVAVIVVPLLLGIVARRKAQARALAATRPAGTLHFPSPALTQSKTLFRVAYSIATGDKTITGKGLSYAPSISVEPDGIRAWSGGSKLHEIVFIPRASINKITPFFSKEGVRTFPTIAVGILGAWDDENGTIAPPENRTEDFVLQIPVGSVAGDAYSEHDGYTRADAIAREAARILGVVYLSPEELEAQIVAQQRAAM